MSNIKYQAGTVPMRRTRDGGVEVLLVTSRYTGQWLCPKGGIDPGESARTAALRETEEEAGVTGTLGPRLGSYDYPRGEGLGRVEIFVLEVERQFSVWPEQSQRKRRWFPLDEALKVGERAEVRLMLRDLVRFVGDPSGAGGDANLAK